MDGLESRRCPSSAWRQALHKKERHPCKSQFCYDPAKDCYFCPEGKPLPYECTDEKRARSIIGSARPWFASAPQTTRGGASCAWYSESSRKNFEALNESCKEIYARRKTRVEHSFGHIKRNLKGRWLFGCGEKTECRRKRRYWLLVSTSDE
jgi:hypothetical protein